MMYKLLVVDDEFNIREGIANSIRWETIGVEVVGTASNGIKALEMAEVLKPDIVITDVNMDNMDGLELTEVLKQRFPAIRIIILSGYDEFEYVKRALNLKVYSYVMKPARSREILEIVRNLLLEMDEEKKLQKRINSLEMEMDRNRPVFIERFLLDLLYEDIGSRDEFLGRSDFLNLRFDKTFYTCMVVSIADSQSHLPAQRIRRQQQSILGIREITEKDMAGFEIRSLVGEYGNLTMIIGGDEPDENQFKASISTRLEIVVEHVSRLLGFSISITIGGIYTDPFRISRSYKEASMAHEHNAIAGEAGILHIDDVSGTLSTRFIYPSDKEKMLLKCLAEVNEKDVSHILKNMLDDMEAQNCSRDRMKVEITGLLSALTRKAMDMGVDMFQLHGHHLLNCEIALQEYDTRELTESWLKNIIVGTIKEIRKQQANHIKNVIKLANHYLTENYDNPGISLVSISNFLHLNPSYFSRLFKKETGETYVEALTKLRLEKAKKMLKETNEKLNVISVNVGYTDSKYFSTIFKKHYGLTPIEYREA